MKNVVHFYCLFLSILLMIVLSACAGDVTAYNQTIPSVQAESNVSPSPIATAVGASAVPATAVTILSPTEPQLAPKPTDATGSSDPYQLPFIKPADSDTPAAGICPRMEGSIVDIKLGYGADGLPLGGRCVQVVPEQRLKLINPTNSPIHVVFSQFDMEVPANTETLLDKPVGDYLARGVHFLPNGPEIWLVDSAPTPVVTAPPPVRVYINAELGYSLVLPGDWTVEEVGMSAPNREVIFSPPNAEPFIAYLSISIDPRTLEQVEQSYLEQVPDAQKSSVSFAGETGLQYIFSYGRTEIFIPHQGKTFLIATDRPNLQDVRNLLSSFAFHN
jgi:hypothetical protein